MTDFPILEFDPEHNAIINPRPPRPEETLPPHGVLCFFQDVLKTLVAEGKLRLRFHLSSELGPNPVYELVGQEPPMFVYHPGLGAPLAAGFLDEVIAFGGRRMIACGGSGVLDGSHDVGHIFIIETAVRDEGTSYQYIAPSREISASPRAVAALAAVLEEHQVPVHKVKSWTTDCFYRETPLRRNRRAAEGCEIVEMEAAAFFAVSQFRGVEFGELVYAGDVVIPGEWDGRKWQSWGEIRQALFWLAVKACSRL
ncbi:MAG TPA: nucleoside phosphorylase [Anaerolineaceae bacterium]|mgnify:FL=1|nr:nucleoside phosphorylase [Anaerolineaceae bacterium]